MGWFSPLQLKHWGLITFHLDCWLHCLQDIYFRFIVGHHQRQRSTAQRWETHAGLLSGLQKCRNSDNTWTRIPNWISFKIFPEKEYTYFFFYPSRKWLLFHILCIHVTKEQANYMCKSVHRPERCILHIPETPTFSHKLSDVPALPCGQAPDLLETDQAPDLTCGNSAAKSQSQEKSFDSCRYCAVHWHEARLLCQASLLYRRQSHVWWT